MKRLRLPLEQILAWVDEDQYALKGEFVVVVEAKLQEAPDEKKPGTC